MIDVFGYRAAKGATSAVIALFERLGAAITTAYAPVALTATAAWTLSTVFIATRRVGSGQSAAGSEETRASV